MTGELTEPEKTPAALAATWRKLMRAAEELGISDIDRRALVDRADAVLDSLATTPANTDAALVAAILFRRAAGDD